MKKSLYATLFLVFMMVFAINTMSVSANGFVRRSCTIASSVIAGRGVLNAKVHVSLNHQNNRITSISDRSIHLSGFTGFYTLTNSGTQAFLNSDRKSATLHGWGLFSLVIPTPWGSIPLLSKNISGKCTVRL